MKRFIFVFVNILSIASSFRENVEIIERNATIIPTEIISNYLHKFFSFEYFSLSIALSSSNLYQQYFQADLIEELVTNSKLNDYSFSILNKVYQKRIGNTNVFNLILIDEGDSLR